MYQLTIFLIFDTPVAPQMSESWWKDPEVSFRLNAFCLQILQYELTKLGRAEHQQHSKQEYKNGSLLESSLSFKTACTSYQAVIYKPMKAGESIPLEHFERQSAHKPTRFSAPICFPHPEVPHATFWLPELIFICGQESRQMRHPQLQNASLLVQPVSESSSITSAYSRSPVR